MSFHPVVMYCCPSAVIFPDESIKASNLEVLVKTGKK